MSVGTWFPDLGEGFASMLGALRGRRVAVLGHLRPDGDCIGSQVALVRLLRSQGIDAIGVNHHAVPRPLRAFVGDTPFVAGEPFRPDGHVGVSVDCADLTRLGQPLRSMFPEIEAMVDHHLSNPGFARLNLLDTSAAATAEILAGMVFDAGLPLDPVAAQALYVGIATDTGQFRFPSTTRRVFRLADALIGAGADPATAAAELYEHESLARMLLLQRFLASFELRAGGRVCVGFLREADFAETGATREDTEGLVDYARSIDGVEIGALLEERDGGVKGSLRAKDPARRVDRIAARYNGGGHACAAGLNVHATTLEAFTPIFLDAVEATLKA